jgi:hypothetical protein
MAGTLNIRTRLRPTDSPSEVYAAMAAVIPPETLLSFGGGILRELRQELHTWERVAEWAADLARRLNRPVLLNFPGPNDTSRTIALAPGWSQEKLSGYLAARHVELEAAYGEIERIVAAGESTHK